MKNKLLLILTAFTTLITWQSISYAQVINLGTAADFVLFTTNGAVTNTGITHLTGHVGTNVGGSTGFGNVDGVMHDQDPASAAATIDLNIAYLELDAAVATFFPGILLGAGQTLNAGVYSIPAAATMNGALYLDAQGDPNAVFILQIEGTFGVGTGSQVTLLNGAQACNVYWKIEGQVSLAPNVTIRGTIVANNAAIAMSAGDSLEGRALSINGAVGVDAIVAYTPLGCLAPILTGPGNPIMGTTECFVLFSGIGPVTNVGITTVTGDIGSNNGLTTGYNPLLVTGSIHPVPDGATAQCGADFTNIYNNLNALPYDIELLYPAQFGNNLVLTPHVYLMNGAVTFTDSLYLNAQGNADAVFVIQVNGAFNTSTFSKVLLLNGTQAQNVYWVINGAVSISDYSIFNGTIISQGAIDLLTGVTLYGRALTGVGAISTFAIDAIMPSSCSPVTIIQPNDTLVCDGQSASFTVVAEGIGLTYQWRRGTVDLVNGGNISGATTATLTINPATVLDQANDYNVVIAGSFVPNDTSNFVSLTIDFGPVITTQPMNVTACAGDSISFIVAATGNGLTYQWRRGIVDLVNGATISGVTNDTLTIDPTSMGDAANDYNVVVSGACLPDAISNFVSLTIDVAPVITTQPLDVIVCDGDSISFIVAATGTGLTYQWRRGIVDLVNGATISGVTNDTLTIDPTSIGDVANDYNVVVYGTCMPNDTSNFVSLTIDVAPVITTQPMDAIVCAGDSVSFIVVSTGTGVSYQWRRGIVDLVNGATISGVTNDTLTIDPTSIGDAANDYNVVVYGVCMPNDTSNFVSLTIDVAPQISTQPLDVTACAGDSISFIVAATGTGLTYQWRRGIVDLVNGATISGVTNDTLTIDPTSIGDAANDYNVVVYGTCMPNDTSNFVSLTIDVAPVITTEPIDATVCEGNSASFTAVSTGSGNTYQWRKGSVDLVNGGNISGATTATLTINPTSISDQAIDYNLVITGTCLPNDTSVYVSLIIDIAPVITTEPMDATVCNGTSANFTVVSTGIGISYQWRKGIVNLVDGGSISGATTATLSINPATFADAANNYNVVITGSCLPDAISMDVILIVDSCLTDVSVVKTASSMTPVMGETIVFTIVASNLSTINATGVLVVENLQSGYGYVSSSSTAGTYNPSTGIWTIGNLDAGNSATLTISAEVLTSGSYENTVTISSLELDTDLSNNVSTILPLPIDFFIPEGFSPNGDLVNDLFVIRGILNFPSNTITIYNRWGNEVFAASPYQSTWDGKSTSNFNVGGDILPVGTYFYVLDLGDGSNIYKGTIFLNN